LALKPVTAISGAAPGAEVGEHALVVAFLFGSQLFWVSGAPEATLLEERLSLPHLLHDVQ
jgi:hypothetical protein